MKSIAVLLTVYNRKEQTLHCLQNVIGLEMPHDVVLDIFLTNDGCTDGTPKEVHERFPQVHIVNGDGNLFWNRGMYTAWDEAAKTRDYDFYLWLNDDTFVVENLLDILLKSSDSKQNKSIIVGCTQSRSQTQVTYGGRCLSDGEIPKPDGILTEVDYFNGNIVFVPKYVFKKVGNLDYYYRHSKGDFDYGLRAKKKGIKSFQVGQILGVCEWHDTIDKWCNPNVPLRARWNAMMRPTGMPPKEIFHMNLIHNGLFSAIIHYVFVYLRCLFPQIWVRFNKVKDIKN